MAYRLGIRVYDFGSPHCITGVSSELIVRLYLLCAYLVVVPTAVHLPLEGLVVCIIYYLLLIYLLPSGAARRHLYCLSLRTGRLFYLYKLGHRRFISMPFSISLDLASKGPHYEISPILALFASFRRRSPIWP